jgi:copper(I)-binding protein
MAGSVFRAALIMASAAAVSMTEACVEWAPPRPDVRVEGAWVRAVAGPDASTAAYMVLRNAGGAPDRLTGARCEASRVAELHRTTIDAAGLARMERVEVLALPAESAVEMQPGGYHLMLMGVGQLVQGDTIGITLELESFGPVEVAAEVRAF